MKMSVLRVLVCAILYTHGPRLYLHSANISNGKDATQSTTHIDVFGISHEADMALDKTHAALGSLTGRGSSSWWQVDLLGYFHITNITLTAVTQRGWHRHMPNAFVEVMDRDVSLCSDVQKVLCGAVSSTVAAGETFTFTCDAIFPVRFVRVTRRSTDSVGVHLGIGHIDIQGEGTKKPYRSYYTTSQKKTSQSFLTTSAMTAGECGIICQKRFSCINFSYSATAPTEENCLLTDKTVSSNYVYDNSWTTYILSCM